MTACELIKDKCVRPKPQVSGLDTWMKGDATCAAGRNGWREAVEEKTVGTGLKCPWTFQAEVSTSKWESQA